MRLGASTLTRRLRVVVPLTMTLACAAPLPAQTVSEVARTTKPEALVLNSYHHGLGWSDEMTRGVSDGLDGQAELIYEFMDTKRFSSPEYLDRLRDLYRLKYAGRSWDVIIATDDAAFQFLLRHRDDLFPGAPVVFCGVNVFDDAMLSGRTNFTGILERSDLFKSVSVALRLNPRARRVIMITDDTVNGRGHRRQMEDEVAPRLPTGIQVVYYDETCSLTIPRLIERLNAEAPDAIVYYSDFFHDALGRFVDYETELPRLSAACRLPIFAQGDMYLGRGIVGGYIISAHQQGYEAGRMARRILAGETPGAIPIVRDSPNRYMFDYEQLRRFDIDRSLLPPDSIVINQPESAYRRYRGMIQAAAGLILAQTIIIALLIANILGRRRAERQWRESELRFSKAFQLVPEVLIISRMSDGVYLEVNDAFVREFGFLREEAVGHSALDLGIWTSAEHRDAFIQELREKGRVNNRETLFRRKNGEVFPALCSMAPIQVHGEPCLLAMTTDITRRKRDEEQQRLNELRLTALLRLNDMKSASLKEITDFAMERAIELTSSQIGYIAFVNDDESVLTMHSWSRQAMAECRIADKPLEYKTAETGLWGEAVRQRKPIITNDYDAPSPLKKGYPEGHVVVRRHMNAPIFDGGRIVIVAGVGNKAEPYDETDVRQLMLMMQGVWTIVQRQKAEEQRKQLETQMQHAQKLESLGILAGGIAHDFNNLLMAILGNADLALMDLPAGVRARNNLVEIENASRRAADLCRQMLAYSGQGRIKVQPVNLSRLVEEMGRMLEVSVSRKASLRYHFDPNLPAVEADATQMRQIIMNLLTNASEALGEEAGAISITTGVMECDRAYLASSWLNEDLPAGRYVFVEVADSGCGMDEATLARIFDPFFTTKFTGRGLGLAAVLGIIRGHRGAIKVYSEPGKGSTFKVLLPALKETAAEAPAEAAPGSGWRGHGTVLVVDDEPNVRSIAMQMLERMGFAVVTAADGREALDIFQSRAAEFRCVLLDLTMPRMDGAETFREMRRVDPQVRVLLSSGYSEPDAVQRFAGKGLAGFIQKPYQYAALRQALQAALG